MKAIALIFLLIYTTDVYSATLGNFGAPLCGYGLYHYDGVCADFTADSNDCKDYFGANNGHLISIPVSAFRFLESGDIACYGMYDKIVYDTSIIQAIKSAGDYSQMGGNICGYGKYHLNGVCYSYSDVAATGACRSNYHLMGADGASFMGLQRVEPYCLGDYYMYNYPDLIHPIYNGTLLTFGSPIGVVIDMKSSDCSVNGDNYYKIGITGTNSYAYPKLGMCDVGYSKFAVKNNCWHIDTDDVNALRQAHVCGVLCDSADYVYTNSGVCSTNGYCMNGDSQMRLHVARPDGEKYSYPLYASKTSTPALNFKFLDKVTNEERMCYVNLVPPDAINHFVGVKPNPIRVGKSLDWTDSAGTHTTTNLITID